MFMATCPGFDKDMTTSGSNQRDDKCYNPKVLMECCRSYKKTQNVYN